MTLTRGLKWSLVLHSTIFLSLLLKSLVFPRPIKPYVPSLRVDIVELPDLTKSELPDSLPRPKSTLSESIPKEIHEDDQMNYTSNKKKPKPKIQNSKRKDRTKNALARIKALEKLNELEEAPSTLIKGNKISKGFTLKGTAQESDENAYYDQILERLQSHWSLPHWLTTQNLSAQVQIFIDGRGKIRHIKFIKTSGEIRFDEAVKRTIALSEPFPAPPKEMKNLLLTRGILLGFPL